MCSLEELKKYINSFNNETINIKPKIKGDSNYVLDQYNIRQRRIEYQETIAKNKKQIKNEHEVKLYDNASDFMNAFEQNRYLKKWHRLDEYAKRIKMNEFFEKWLTQNQHIKFTPKELTNKLIIQHSLNKRFKIDYDDKNGIILSIDKIEEYIK
jgi:hypothetical protein